MSEHPASGAPAESHRYAVVVAGGAGTRLWPLSREDLPKQIQALIGERSLITETVERLKGIVPVDHIYVSTTANYVTHVRHELPEIRPENVIVEPIARGTAPAFALFAHQLHERDPEAIVFSLASDHVVTGVRRFHRTLEECFEFVERHPDQLAIVGITPTRADPTLGYIKVRRGTVEDGSSARSVEKFVEKPSAAAAAGHIASGDYYWNAAYYCFAAKTLLDAYDAADPRLHQAARNYIASGDVNDYLTAPEKVHEIEPIDTARHPMVVIPADFAWSDVGSWDALHAALTDGQHAHRSVNEDWAFHTDVDGVPVDVQDKGNRIVASVGVGEVAVQSTRGGVVLWFNDTTVAFAGDAVLVLDSKHQDKIGEVLAILREHGKSDYL